MEFTDQMAAKLLAQAVRHLGMALNETLCVEPDRTVVRRLVADVQETLAEFQDAYTRNAGTAAPVPAAEPASGQGGSDAGKP